MISMAKRTFHKSVVLALQLLLPFKLLSPDKIKSSTFLQTADVGNFFPCLFCGFSFFLIYFL